MRHLKQVSERKGDALQSKCDFGHLADSGIFPNLTSSEIAHLSSIARSCVFEENEVIFEAGDRLSTFIMIEDGTARLYRASADGHRQVLGFLGVGDVLGAIKRNDVAYCSAQAIGRIEACCFNRSSLRTLMNDNANLCMTLLVAATDEIETQYDHSVILSHRHANKRLAAFLILWSASRNPLSDRQDLIQLPMPRSDIADYLGLTIETVSRVFGEFKTKGLVELQGSKVVVLKNLPALYDLAEFHESPDRRVSIGL